MLVPGVLILCFANEFVVAYFRLVLRIEFGFCLLDCVVLWRVCLGLLV